MTTCARPSVVKTELLFSSLLTEDRSVLDLLTADYTFVNERLAKHYGIPGIRGSDFRRVTLDKSLNARLGIARQGRGAHGFVAAWAHVASDSAASGCSKNMLGVPAPDPPPNVPVLDANTGDAAGNSKLPSMRQHARSDHRTEPGLFRAVTS